MKIKLAEKGCLPYRANDTDAGLDLRTRYYMMLKPEEWGTIETGVYVEIPEGNFGLIVPRSGLGSMGLELRNTVGIIDAHYRGEILLKVINKGTELINLEKYERVAQLIILPFTYADLEVMDKLGDTERGQKGFGESGKY